MSGETMNKDNNHLDKDFAKINKLYQEYYQKKQADSDYLSTRTNIMKTVYELFNKTKYWSYISELGEEICRAVVRCLNNYEKYDKKEYVPFSQFVYSDIVNFVIRPNKVALDQKFDKSLEMFKAGINYKIYKLNKLIDLYYKEREKQPDFSDSIIFNWFKEQLNWTEKQLRYIIQYYIIKNTKTASLDSSDKSDDEKLYDTLANPNAENPKDMIDLEIILQTCQDIWEADKSCVSKKRISSLFTRHFLKNMHKFGISSQTDLFNEYTIFDQDILSKYFAGEWTHSSFYQKDIAKLLQISPEKASRILNSFLNKAYSQTKDYI